MKKRLVGYLSYLEAIEYDKLSKEQREKLLNDLLVQIGFFQHERLIHLMVTLAFAVFAVVGLVFVCTYTQLWAIALEALFVILLVPYINHYYLLENGVQKLYGYYDKLLLFTADI